MYLKEEADLRRYKQEGERFVKFARKNSTELKNAIHELRFDTKERFTSAIQRKEYTWQELEAIQFDIPTKGNEITEENLTIAFTLLKRAQQVMGIFCRH